MSKRRSTALDEDVAPAQAQLRARTGQKPRTNVIGSGKADAYLRSRHSSKSKVSTSKAKSDAADARPLFPPRGEVVSSLSKINRAEEEVRSGGFPFPNHADQYGKWRSQLLAGFNILVVGMGSKVAMLQVFMQEQLADCYVLQLYGYMPVVSTRSLIQSLQQILDMSVTQKQKTLLQQCQDIGNRSATSSSTPIILLIHSIDGIAMRTPALQSCLSWLARSPRIHLVASMDQINGPSLWQEDDALRFAWIYETANTYRPYTSEIDLRLTKQARLSEQSETGVQFILQSLTPTDVGIVKVIARQCIQANTKKNQPGQADFHNVLEDCSKSMVHLSVPALRHSVRNLEEHGLVRTVKGQRKEMLEIPLRPELIRSEILAFGEKKAS